MSSSYTYNYKPTTDKVPPPSYSFRSLVGNDGIKSNSSPSIMSNCEFDQQKQTSGQLPQDLQMQLFSIKEQYKKYMDFDDHKRNASPEPLPPPASPESLPAPALQMQNRLQPHLFDRIGYHAGRKELMWHDVNNGNYYVQNKCNRLLTIDYEETAAKNAIRLRKNGVSNHGRYIYILRDGPNGIYEDPKGLNAQELQELKNLLIAKMLK